MIITFANQKGGAGKTTMALTTWAALNPGCLAIDLDTQGNFSSTTSDSGEPEYSIFDVLMDKCQVTTAIRHTAEGDYIAASPELFNINVPLDTLKKVLEPMKSQYKYIVLDTPPAVGNITLNALTATDILIIPVVADKYAFDGVNQLIDVVNFIRANQNPNLRIGGLVMTQFTRGTVKKQLLDFAGQVATSLNTRLFKATIRESVVVTESHLESKTLFDYAPHSKVTQDFNNFIKELKEVL